MPEQRSWEERRAEYTAKVKETLDDVGVDPLFGTKLTIEAVIPRGGWHYIFDELALETSQAFVQVVAGVRGEPNDSVTRRKIAYQMSSFLRPKTMLACYLVTCDDSNNAPDLVDEHGVAISFHFRTKAWNATFGLIARPEKIKEKVDD